jgi:uncharacterized protein
MTMPPVSYPVLITLHLVAALIFIGAVFFEVLILEGVRNQVRPDAMREIEQAIGRRARRLMPWVVLVLFGSGIGLGWHYRAALVNPLQSGLGTLLTLKILLALSVLAHFIRAISWSVSGRLTARRVHFIHLSVFFHMVGIVLLAKNMFHMG